MDKNRVLWAKYALPRFNGHPDLTDKTLSPEGAVKSGSDCSMIKKVFESLIAHYNKLHIIKKCLILDPKTKQVWWIAGAVEIKNMRKC